jgi:hypothetical protein
MKPPAQCRVATNTDVANNESPIRISILALISKSDRAKVIEYYDTFTNKYDVKAKRSGYKEIFKNNLLKKS